MTESSSDNRKDRGKRLKKQPSRQSSRIMFGCQHCDCLHFQRDDDNDPSVVKQGNDFIVEKEKGEKDHGSGSCGSHSHRDMEDGDKSISKSKGRKRQKLRKDTEEEDEPESPSSSSERSLLAQVSDLGTDLLSEKSEAGSDLSLDENGGPGSKSKMKKKQKTNPGEEGEEVIISKARNDSVTSKPSSSWGKDAKGEKGAAAAEKPKNHPCLCGHSHQDHCKSKPNPFTKKKSSVSLDNLSVMDQIGEVFTQEDKGFLSDVTQAKRNYRQTLARDWSTSCVSLPTPGEKKKKKEAEENSNVHKVDFSRGELTEVPSIPQKQASAAEFIVDLGHNNLSSSSLFSLNVFPDGITALHLNNNSLAALPPGFPFALKKLRILSLSHNQLSELPNHLGDMVELESLQLDHNSLTHVPLSLSRLTNLVQLHLGHNNLQRLPESIGDLPLTSFRVNHNELTSFPNSFSNLTQLRYLIANHNRLRFISPLLFRLPNLKKMVVSDNDLHKMPEFMPLSPLTTLGLERNSLRTLPLLLSHLRKLETFSIQGNPFQDPFNAWAEREAKSSSTQELGDAVEKEGKREEKKGEGESEGVLIGEENHRQISLRLLKKFKKIPEQWLAIYTAACRGDRIIIQDLLEEGTSLDIQDAWGYTPLAHAIEQGRMEAITTLLALGASPELEKLEAGSLSTPVKKLLNLYRMGLDEKEIDLSGCGLTKLPKRVLEFHSLTSLNLKDNMIDFIPPALSSLQSIQTLQLEGNPLSLCSLEGLNSASDVLAELKKTVEMRTEKWVHMKVVYLGNPGVGKTSVARAIAGTTHSSWRTRSDSASSDGASISERKESLSDYPPPSPSSLNSAPSQTVPLEVTKWSSAGIHFTCWDPSCRPYFLPVLPSMMTRGAVCVVVFSLNDPEMENGIRKWLNFISIRHGRPLLSVILVGTHTDLEHESQTVAKNRANWDDIVKRLSKDYRCIREKVLCCVENEEKGVQKLRDALLRLCRLRMEAAPSCLKVVPKSCLNFLARINSYRNRFLVSAPFVMEIADECGVPPERVDEYIQLFITGGFYLMSPGGRWLVVDVQMLFDLFGTLFQRRSDARRMKGVFGTHLVTSLKGSIPLEESITILQDYDVVLKLQPATPFSCIPHEDISSFLHSLSVSAWRTKVQPQNAPSLNYTYVVLPEFLPAERPECEQFVGMFSELPSVCHSPFERLFSIPPVSYGVLSRIFVRLVNQPQTNCLLAWKEGIMIQRINPLNQRGGRRGRFRCGGGGRGGSGGGEKEKGKEEEGRGRGKKGSRGPRMNGSPLSGSSMSREEVDFAIRDIVVVEYITSICKLKLTVFSACSQHHYLCFQMKELISLIEGAVFDLLPGMPLEQEVLCRHCRKSYWGKLGRGKFKKLFMNDSFEGCTSYSYEDLRAASITGGSFVKCKKGPFVTLDCLVPEVEWKHTRTLSADHVRITTEGGRKENSLFQYGKLGGENGKFSVAIQAMTKDFASTFSHLATLCHNTSGAHGCGVAGVRGVGGYSCSDSRGAGMKWMYESVQRRIHSLGYLKHPNLAHLIGSLNQYPLRVLWRWEKCESLTDVLGHFWKTKLSQDFSKCPRSIKKGAPVTILSQKENGLAFGRQGKRYFKAPAMYLEGEPKEKVSIENRMSIILDIARALNALHTQTYPPITHGYLSSDSIFVKKSESGECRAFLAGHGMKGYIHSSAFLQEDLWRWTCPELLLFPSRVLSHTETMAHDVYSFGMLMYELAFHRVPFDSAPLDVRTFSASGYFDCSLCLRSIIESRLRPASADRLSSLNAQYFQLMEQCWHPDPKQRPTFPDILTRLTNILSHKDEKGNEATLEYNPPEAAPQSEPITPVSNLIHVLNPHGAVLSISSPRTGWAENAEDLEKENYLWVGTDKGRLIIVNGKSGEIVKSLSVMMKNKEKDSADFRTYWVRPSPVCLHHMWSVDEDGSLTCFDARTFNVVGRKVGSGRFTKSVLVVPLQSEEPRGGDKWSDRKAPLTKTQRSSSCDSKKSRSTSPDPSEPIYIPKNNSFSFADLVGASQHLPYTRSSTVRPASAHLSHLTHSISAGSPRSPSSSSPPPPSPSSSSSSSPPSPSSNENSLAPPVSSLSPISSSPPPSPSASPPPSPSGAPPSNFVSTPLPSSIASSPLPSHAVSSSSSFLSVESTPSGPSPSPFVATTHSHPYSPPTSSASLPSLPSISPPPSRASVLSPSARETPPLSLPAATQSFLANHPNTASVSLFSVVKNESEVKFESKFVETSPEKEKGPFDYEIWVGRSDAVLNILGAKNNPDSSEFVLEDIGEITIPDAVLCMCAVRGVEVWVGSPIAIFRILISTRKLIDCIQTKEMRTHVSCMTYVDNTGEVWTSDDAGGVISIRSARSGRTKETIDLDGDKVTSMSVFGEQVLCGTFKGSIIVFDSRRYTVLQTLLKSHHSSVRCFATTPNAFWSGGRDKALCAWGIRWCEDDPTLYRVESEYPPEKEESGKNRKSWAWRFLPKF